MEDIARTMENARMSEVREKLGGELANYIDYRPTLGDEGNVLEFDFTDGSRAMMRPSGTEPKLKIYISACSTSKENAEAAFSKIRDKVVAAIGL